MDEGAEVRQNVEDSIKEKRSQKFTCFEGVSTYEVVYSVHGTYSSDIPIEEVPLRLAQTKMLMEMKRKSCAVMSELRQTLERSMANLRRERRELLRISAMEYRRKLRRRN